MALSTLFLGKRFRNPIVLASGIVGYGKKFDEEVGLDKVGGIITKTVTALPRPGNPLPRVAEVDSGMLNSIGLANPGIDKFISDQLPYLQEHKTNIIVSIAGGTSEELLHLALLLDNIEYIDALELNLSCPNVAIKMQTSQDPRETFRAVDAVKAVTRKQLIAKLSPNVSDVVEVARKAVEAGADALSLINTLGGIKVDPVLRKFVLGNVTGGLSGPAIRPVGVKMVYDIKKELDIPVIAHGGIVDQWSALEYLLVGADLIALGSGLFKNPDLTEEVSAGLEKYLHENGATLADIRGELL